MRDFKDLCRLTKIVMVCVSSLYSPKCGAFSNESFIAGILLV
jgi:hypothetical protein